MQVWTKAAYGGNDGRESCQIPRMACLPRNFHKIIWSLTYFLYANASQNEFWKFPKLRLLYPQDVVTGPSPSISSCIGPSEWLLGWNPVENETQVVKDGKSIIRTGTFTMDYPFWCGFLALVQCVVLLADQLCSSFLRRGSCRPVLNHIKDHQMGDCCSD